MYLQTWNLDSMLKVWKGSDQWNAQQPKR